jgi:hypothetical protein
MRRCHKDPGEEAFYQPPSSASSESAPRWEYYPQHFLGFVQLVCLVILFRRF